jgi:two-component system, chemotaxis family, protein-glutamate methylesterase/glutaminase
MGKIRVLVVDDSVVVRRIVTEELSADPEIEIAGTAANGEIAIAKMTQVCPDLVTLDVEMPEMDGLTALARIRKSHPNVPVIMFSALTERGAAATLDALALGASDYFTKPTGAGGPEESRRLIRAELIPAIKALCKGKFAVKPALQPAISSTYRPATPSTGRVDVVAVGVSTGGPNALAELFRVLPADFPVPLLIVQHMPPMFTRLLAERLTATSRLPADEATSGALLAPGRALIAPGDYHMIVVRNGMQVKTILHQDPAENSCRPAVDPLFRSVAKVYGPNCLAVVLTGMGQDGLRGCEVIRAAGGQVIAQDEASSVVWGMPGFVARAGLAERVLPLALIGGEIVRRVGGSRVGAP